MAAPFEPTGEERQVPLTGGTTIDGAPVAYIVVLAAVVVVLSFIPFSVVFAAGGGFPLSQGIYGLVGILLGPWAGALAAGIGRIIGIFIAPHTAGGGLPSALFAVAWTAAGGILVQKRGRAWLYAFLFFLAAYLLYVGTALTKDVTPTLALANSAVNLLGLALWVLPTRALARRWIADPNLGRVAAGLFLGCFMVNALGHTFANMWLYVFVNPWPAQVWAALVPIIPVEQFFRTLVGTVIGVGVIAGLRAIGLKKPAKAGF
ncbi:MAG: hypothetical protein GX605_13485 [Chloroflexi bacterium]|nr:hypothetical protein [Chloroflexota bacterium]